MAFSLRYMSSVFLGMFTLSFFVAVVFFNVIVNGIISLIYLTFTLLLYRNATYFCISILYLANILNSLINCSSFLKISLEFPMCSIMPSAKKFTSLLMWIPLISFSCLFSVDRKSKNTLNKSEESGHSNIFLILEEIFQLFTVVIYDLYFVEICSL